MRFASIRSPVITIMSGSHPASMARSFALPSPNSASCRSDTCAMRKPSNPAGMRASRTVMRFTISAVLPHASHAASAASVSSTMPAVTARRLSGACSACRSFIPSPLSDYQIR